MIAAETELPNAMAVILTQFYVESRALSFEKRLCQAVIINCNPPLMRDGLRKNSVRILG